mmetsp:Transcript_27794/g.41355  ORF Transcript_27794/g.41355 Transcript_27794/m.41355 type:complete len:397 (+) Transcript_27794:633-1823(+)
MSYVRKMAGAHLVAIQSANLALLGIAAKDVSNNSAPAAPPLVDITSCTRTNSASQSSADSISIPGKEDNTTSSPLDVGTDLSTIKAAASPRDKREERLVSPFSVVPYAERVGSRRMERSVISSRRIGSRRGPPMNGDASPDDSGTPKRSPCLKTVTVAPEELLSKALANVAGTSTPAPPKSPFKRLLPPFSSSPAAFCSSATSLKGCNATLTPFDADKAAASRVATLSASFNFCKSSISLVMTSRSRLTPVIAVSSTTPSMVQMTASLDPHHLPTAASAEPTWSDDRSKLGASAPAKSKLPPALDMVLKVSSDRENFFLDCESWRPEETTNQRTDPPAFAADTAAISPNPPGGEMTTTFLLLSGADESDIMDMGEEDVRYLLLTSLTSTFLLWNTT